MKKYFNNLISNNVGYRNLLKSFNFDFRTDCEKNDLFRIAVLFKAREYFLRKEKLTDEITDQIYNDIDKLSYKKLDKYIKQNLNEQVIQIFKSINEEETSLPHIKSTLMKSATSSSSLISKVGFELKLKTSTISNSGKGLFVHGDGIHPGTVITLYPGYVHSLEYLSKKDYVNKLLPDDNMMLMGRHDGIVIDGRGYDLLPFNPYALGHMINHATSEHPPNVIPTSYDFQSATVTSKGFPVDLVKYVPNDFYQPRTFFGSPDRSALMNSIAFVSCKPIKSGDEILVDYRLHPLRNNPSWYKHYDIKESQLRWEVSDEMINKHMNNNENKLN